jgi:hypothetical protein
MTDAVSKFPFRVRHKWGLWLSGGSDSEGEFAFLPTALLGKDLPPFPTDGQDRLLPRN